jgi:thiol:disulfide interchange protein DsbD
MRATGRILLVVLALVLFSAAGAQDSGKPIVKATAYLSKTALQAGGDFKLAIVIDIAQGYHIGAAVKDADWPAILELSAAKDITFAKPKYPAPKMKAYDSFGDDPLPVYEGKVTIFVDGKVAKNAAAGKRAITAKFSYQACAEDLCIPPETITLKINTRVAAVGEKVMDANRQLFKSEPKPISQPAKERPAK